VGSGPARSEWVLEQEGPTFAETVAYVSHDAVRIVSSRYKFELVAKAPDWTVHAFRSNEKLEWTGPMDQFTGPMMSNPFRGNAINDVKLKPATIEEKCGWSCRKYENKTTGDAVWAALNMPVAPRVAEFLCRCYDSPIVPEVVISHARYETAQDQPPVKSGAAMDFRRHRRGGWNVRLETKSSKTVPFRAQDFDLPHGYTRAMLSQITFSNTKKGDITDMIDSLGFQVHGKKESK
jgi:hypothetical protein